MSDLAHEYIAEAIARSGTATGHRFLTEFSRWCAQDDRISSALLIGSYAGGTATPESDIDIIIFSASPRALLEDNCWSTFFGSVVRRSTYPDRPLPAVYLQYSSGLEVEAGITDIRWQNREHATTIASVLASQPGLQLYSATGAGQ